MTRALLQTREHGISLIVAITYVGLLAAIATVTLTLISNSARISASHAQSEQAFWLAEAGVEAAQAWLRWLPKPPSGTAPFAPFDQIALGGGTFMVEIDPDDGNLKTYLKKYTIVSTGEAAGLQRRIRFVLEMRPFSRYAYFTNSEGGTIWFTTGDLIEGPLHSNDRISIMGRPVFDGKVTSSANSFRQGAGYNPDFREGYQLGVPPIQLPTWQEMITNFQINNGSNAFLDVDVPFWVKAKAELIFNANGTMTYGVWRPKPTSGKNYLAPPLTVSVQSTNGLIVVHGDVEVSGTLDGSVTVVAEGDIEIPDDVRYAAAKPNGEPLPACDDYLGLIAAGNIIVMDTHANRTDCVIDAALLALDDSFTVEKYNTGNHRGELTVYGSISQNVRGPVGTIKWNKQTGYSKDYHYDLRLASNVPPYFPVTGVYDVTRWAEIH